MFLRKLLEPNEWHATFRKLFLAVPLTHGIHCMNFWWLAPCVLPQITPSLVCLHSPLRPPQSFIIFAWLRSDFFSAIFSSYFANTLSLFWLRISSSHFLITLHDCSRLLSWLWWTSWHTSTLRMWIMWRNAAPPRFKSPQHFGLRQGIDANAFKQLFKLAPWVSPFLVSKVRR